MDVDAVYSAAQRQRTRAAVHSVMKPDSLLYATRLEVSQSYGVVDKGGKENRTRNRPYKRHMTHRDDGESIGLFEPLMVSEASPHRAELNDLALELGTRSAAFRESLPSSIVDALAALIRSMNCYYSNLIEGHHTHPVDIERALKDDYSSDPE